jgi:hypothetical protein
VAESICSKRIGLRTKTAVAARSENLRFICAPPLSKDQISHV